MMATRWVWILATGVLAVVGGCLEGTNQVPVTVSRRQNRTRGDGSGRL